MSKPSRPLVVKDFQSLALLLLEDMEAITDNEYMYARLRVGDVWWIPDYLTHFSYKESHPWVIVTAYQKGRPPVLACPRTSKKSKGLMMKAGALPGLNKDGWLLLNKKMPFPMADYKQCEYIGRLSEAWIETLVKAIAGDFN